MRQSVIWGCIMLLLPIFGTLVVAQPENTSSTRDLTEAEQLNLLLAEMRKRMDHDQISFESFATLSLQISQMKAEHTRVQKEESRLVWEKEEKEKEVRKEEARLAREEARLAREEEVREKEVRREEALCAWEQKEKEKELDLVFTKLDAEDPVPMVLLPLIVSAVVSGGISSAVQQTRPQEALFCC